MIRVCLLFLPHQQLLKYFVDFVLMIQILLEAGEFPVDPLDEFQWTPLHWAIRNNHFEAVKVLLGFGALPSVKTNALKTPLQIAQLKNNSQILSLLSAHSPSSVCVLLYFVSTSAD